MSGQHPSGTLLELAKELDATEHLETRIGLADRMRKLLAAEYEEFDRRYEALVAAKPDHASPATEVARGLALEVAANVASCFRIHGTAGDIVLEKPGIEVSRAIARLKLLLEPHTA